jgi:hypothetical protein
MVNKKGQLTIFLIISMIVLITLVILFYLQSKITESDKVDIQNIFSLELNTAPIELYIQNCLKKVSLNAIKNVSQQGGYYNLDNILSTNSSLYTTSYYFYENNIVMPNKERVEEEIGNYIDDHLLKCINEFNVFREEGFDISYHYMRSSVTLKPMEASVSIEMPLKITRDSATQKIKSFFIDLKGIRLGKMLDVASILMGKQLFDSDHISLSYIYDVAKNNDFFIHIENEEDSNIYFFIIIDNRSQPPNKLIYANKYKEYSCGDLPLDTETHVIVECIKQEIYESNYSFYLGDIPDMNASVGKNFIYYINASGLNLNFSDSTPLFDIGRATGIINFTPTNSQIGDHIVWISVIDDLGNEGFESFHLNIINQTRW